MTDHGYDKSNGVHLGSEHICAGGLLATYDTGRYDSCPAGCGFNVDRTSKIIEHMTPEETARYAQTVQAMLSSSTFYVLRDPNMIGPMRLLDLRNSIAQRLHMDPNHIRLYLETVQEGDQQATRGVIRTGTIQDEAKRRQGAPRKRKDR